MAWPKGRKRNTAKAHNGKLMIVLRNRHTVWIDMTPEQWNAMRDELEHAFLSKRMVHSIGGDVVRLEDVVHVKYIGPKSAGTDERSEEASS